MGVPCGFPPRGFSCIKAACTSNIQGAGCFFGVAANPSPFPWERVRAKASSGDTNFCSEWQRVLPSPTGRGSWFAVAGIGLPALEYGGGAGCFLRWAAAPSVGMAAQRHETMRIRKFIVLKKNEKAACTSFSTVQAAFLRRVRFMPPPSSLAANSCRRFRACACRW